MEINTCQSSGMESNSPREGLKTGWLNMNGKREKQYNRVEFHRGQI